MEIRQRVRQYIIENFYVSDAADLADDTSLITVGIVDSTGMLEVITFLESEYQITIGDAEMTPDNLETIDRIAKFVAQKKTTVSG